MVINTLIDALCTAIAEDSSVQSWGHTEYDQGVTVFENMDPQDEQQGEQCPMVIVYPMMKSGGLSQGNKVHVVGIACVVYDENKDESVQDVVRFRGGRNVETLRGLVVEVIKQNIPSALHIEAIVTEYNTIEQFPFVSCGMDLTLTEEKLIGQDPYE